MSPEQTARLQRLAREQEWRNAQWSAERLVSLLGCMKAYRMTLPAWCRGAMAVRS